MCVEIIWLRYQTNFPLQNTAENQKVSSEKQKQSSYFSQIKVSVLCSYKFSISSLMDYICPYYRFNSKRHSCMTYQTVQYSMQQIKLQIELRRKEMMPGSQGVPTLSCISGVKGQGHSCFLGNLGIFVNQKNDCADLQEFLEGLNNTCKTHGN